MWAVSECSKRAEWMPWECRCGSWKVALAAGQSSVQLMLMFSLFTPNAEWRFETPVSKRQHIWMNTSANLAGPKPFRFCCLHRARAKQKVAQCGPVSQNETIYDCSDGVTLRVTLKPSCDSPDHSPEVVLPLLSSRFDKHSKTQDLPMNRCFLNHVTLYRQTLVVNLELSFHTCTWPVRLQLPLNAVTATFLCLKTRLENLPPPPLLARPGVFWGKEESICCAKSA